MLNHMTDEDRFHREHSLTQDKYRLDVSEYIEFMKERRLLMLIAVKEYAAWLDRKQNGKRYGPEAINRRILAARDRLRHAFRSSSGAGNKRKARRLEAVMRKVRPEPVETPATTSRSRCSGEEVRKLLNESTKRGVEPMARLLVGTEVQLSEMPAEKLSDLKAVDECFFEIKVVGNGHENRLVHIGTEFVEQAFAEPATLPRDGRGCQAKR